MNISKGTYCNLFFILLLVIFILIKWQYLLLPYFWDEAWVYGNAVNFFIENGISILPHEDTNELTRGHPMLFHFIFGLWGKIFGNSVFSLHSCAIVISCLIFNFIYFKIGEIISRASAIVAVAFLIGLEIFFVQSSMLLPEVMLAFFMMCAIYYFLKSKHILFVISFSLALYTKESAIVLLPLFVVMSLYERFYEKEKHDYKIKLISILVVILIASLHYLYQYYSFGWFFYPMHMGYLDLKFNSINDKLTSLVYEYFISNYKWILLIPFYGGMFRGLNSQSNSVRKYLGISILGFSFLLLCLYLISGNGLSLFTISFMITGLFTSFIRTPDSPFIKKFLIALWLLIIGHMLFCSLNFYSIRYGIPMIVIYSILFGFELSKILNGKVISQIVAGVVVSFFLFVSGNLTHIFSDVDKTYRYGVRGHQQLVKYLSSNYKKDDPIRAEFLERNSLSNQYCGYLTKEREFTNLLDKDSTIMNLRIISNISKDIFAWRTLIDFDNWELKETIANKRCIIEIYEPKEKNK